jgi:hypothetical protein
MGHLIDRALLTGTALAFEQITRSPVGEPIGTDGRFEMACCAYVACLAQKTT